MVHRHFPCLLLALTVALPAAVAVFATDALAVGDPTSEFATPPLRETVAPRDLRAVLALADSDLPLRVRLYSREQQEGYPWRVEGDTLRLLPVPARDPGALAPADTALLSVPVAEIAAVWQRRSGVRAGLSWGAKSGAVVGGGLGMLIGAALSALSDDDSDAAPIMAASLIFAASGVAAGTLVGGAVGALTSDWYPLWPPGDDAAPGAEADGGGTRARWCLEPGWSFRSKAEHDGRGPSLRATILRRIGGRLELGPGLEYHDIEGEVWRDAYYDGPYLAHVSRTLGLGLEVRLNGRGPGLRPLGAAGLGWFLGDDLYVGAQVGAGLRWRSARGSEVSLTARHYLPLTGDQTEKSRFWAVSAGVTLGR